MIKVFFAAIAALTIAAAPASAEFSSNTGKASGSSKWGPLVLEGGGETLECSSASGTGTILSGGKEALKGSELSLSITTWNECKAKSKEIKEIKPVVSAAGLLMTQAAGSTSAKASVKTEWWEKIKFLGFTYEKHYVSGKEAEKINFGLEKNALSNSGSNLTINAEDSGITSTVTGTAVGVTGTKEGKMKATSTTEGIKEV